MTIETLNLLQDNIQWLKPLPSAILLIDLDYTIIGASDTFCQKFNLNNNSITKKRLFDIFPSFENGWHAKLKNVKNGQKDVYLMDRLSLPNGDHENIEWCLNPWNDGYGSRLGIVLMAKDITKRISLEKELVKTKNILNEKNIVSNIASWEYNVVEDKLTVSPNIKSIFKNPPKGEIPLDIAFDYFKPGKSRRKIEEHFKSAIINGEPWQKELQLKCNTNTEFWVNTVGRPKFNDGQCTRVIGTIQDITEKSVNQSPTPVAISSSNDYESIFNALPSPSAIIDFESGKILNVNDELLHFLNCTEKQLFDQNIKNLLRFENQLQKFNLFRSLSKNNCFKDISVNFLSPKQKQVKLKISGNLTADSNEGQKIIVVVQEDFEENVQTKELEERLIASDETINRLVNFTHLVCHSLRGHATNFSLLLNLIEKEVLLKEQQEVIDMLKDSTENMTVTIKGLRELVTIRENIHVNKKLLTVNDYLFKAQQSLNGIITKHKVKILNVISEDLVVYAIPVYLENIITNCLSNSIKFKKDTESPIIVISSEVLDEYTVISIEDNGIGIDLEANKERLFELGKTMQKKKTTRGMGLYLTKYQLNLMDGKIIVESALGEGTTLKLFFKNN